MNSIATIKLKIPENKQIIKTMEQYNKAVSYIADKRFKSKTYNRYKLHHLTYYKTRKKFNLPSQFIINASRVASQTLKSVKTNKGSKPTFKKYLPLPFDKRTFTFSFDKIRVTTLEGRINIPIEIPEYYQKYLDWSYQTAQIIKTKKGMFIHITFSRDIASPRFSNQFHGVDVGINNIAVTSSKQFFNSKHIKTIKKRYNYIRKRLQSKGTRSAKKLLKKISGREKRFIKDCNHVISKAIVSSCDTGDTIVMEKLKGIRGCRVRKKQRYWLNNWSFYQLQRFIEYKAIKNGKRVIYANPHRTSKTCSRCGSIDTIRKGSNFHCLNCSYHLNADLNASFNLRLLGKLLITKADVNQPIVTCNDAKASLGELRQSIVTSSAL